MNFQGKRKRGVPDWFYEHVCRVDGRRVAEAFAHEFVELLGEILLEILGVQERVGLDRRVEHERDVDVHVQQVARSQALQVDAVDNSAEEDGGCLWLCCQQSPPAHARDGRDKFLHGIFLLRRICVVTELERRGRARHLARVLAACFPVSHAALQVVRDRKRPHAADLQRGHGLAVHKRRALLDFDNLLDLDLGGLGKFFQRVLLVELPLLFEAEPGH